MSVAVTGHHRLIIRRLEFWTMKLLQNNKEWREGTGNEVKYLMKHYAITW